MVSPNCLEDVPQDKVFRFNNGSSARNIYELQAQIKSLSQAQFEEHSNPSKDDFVRWVIEVVGDRRLAESLKKAKTKLDYEAAIDKRLRLLERGTWLRCIWKNMFHQLDTWYEEKMLVFAMLILLFVSLAFLTLLYVNLNQRMGTIEDSALELRESDMFIYDQLVQSIAFIQNATAYPRVESPMEIGDILYRGKTSAPSDRLTEEQIFVYNNKIVLSVDNASLARFLNTGSMLPTLGDKANSIEIPVSSSADIAVGDIIIYSAPDQSEPVIHRVVELGEDSQGWYAITKGDNNRLVDPYSVRIGDVRRVVIGVIY